MMERRNFLQGAALGAVLITGGAIALHADGDAAWQGWRDEILAGRSATEEGITLDMAAVAENGAQVPLTIRVDSPMTAEDHVTAIHIIATRNPAPQIGSFRLTPALTRAEAMTRIRVAEEQDILVLAELSDGRVLQQTARIIVSVGGCVT